MAFVKGAAFIAATLALIFLMSYWAAGRAKPLLDQAARDLLLQQGEAFAFMELPDGIVHYSLTGPADGPVVVLIHGFALPSFVWDGYIQPLNAAGYRVLTYDTFGRGFSDRPNGPYDEALMDRQLMGLLNGLKLTQPVDLVGYSMGGAIATIFTANHPAQVRSLSLIAPAGLNVTLGSMSDWLTKPLIGDWIVRLFGLHLFHEHAANESRKAPNPTRFLASFDRQMDWRGFGDALLSTMRHYPLNNAADAYRKAGQEDQPVYVIWGEADETVPYRDAARQIAQLMPRAQIASYRNIGHEITYAHAPLVSGLLLDFLSSVHNATPASEQTKAISH